MKINIHIEDATPEEAGLILSGITVAGAMQRAAVSAVERMVEKPPVIPPTKAGYDGDCQNCERNGACMMDPMPGCFRPKTAAKPEPEPFSGPTFPAAPWMHYEKDIIRPCKDGRDAVSKYFKAFPASKRSRSAVQKYWSTLNAGRAPRVKKAPAAPKVEVKQSVKAIALSNDVKEPASVPVIKVEKTVRDYNKHGDLQIPFTTKTPEGKKQYAAAWSLCKRHGFKPYPEALKLSEAQKAERAAVPKKPTSPAHQRIHEAVAATPPASVIHQKINDIIIKQNGTMHAGQKVRHNGSKASPHFGKEGEILKVDNNGQLFVKFGPTATTWLAPYCVAVIPEVPA